MKSATPKPPASFETALQELAGIVQSLESGGTPLAESLKAYERGVALLEQCQETLNAAEQKVRILDNGKLHDFDDTGSASESED